MEAEINNASVSEVRRKLLTKKQAATEFGVSYRTIERWFNNNYIKYVRIGGRVFISYSEIYRIRDQFIDSKPNGSQLVSQVQTIEDIQRRHEQNFRYGARR